MIDRITHAVRLVRDARADGLAADESGGSAGWREGRIIFNTTESGGTITDVSPTDLEDILRKEPVVPVRLTLASGDQVVIRDPANTTIGAYALTYAVQVGTATHGYVKYVSIPNITLAERLDPRRPPNGHTRRRRK